MTTDALLEEQKAYYRAIASEYEDHGLDAPGQQELLAAFDAFEITGHVLELACGPGAWTERIAAKATSLTAVDASPEMIARARSRVGDTVRFIEADLFTWRPDQRYDAVFFGFWLSHIPDEHFEGFWSVIQDSLKPTGLVFFVDDRHRTAAELIEGSASPVVERKLNDGTTFRAIKVPHEAPGLEQRLRSLGWDITVGASGDFYWGAGSYD